MKKIYNITGLIFSIITVGLFIVDATIVDTDNLYLLFLIQSGVFYILGELEEIKEEINK